MLFCGVFEPGRPECLPEGRKSCGRLAVWTRQNSEVLRRRVRTLAISDVLSEVPVSADRHLGQDMCADVPILGGWGGDGPFLGGKGGQLTSPGGAQAELGSTAFSGGPFEFGFRGSSRTCLHCAAGVLPVWTRRVSSSLAKCEESMNELWTAGWWVGILVGRCIQDRWIGRQLCEEDCQHSWIPRCCIGREGARRRVREVVVRRWVGVSRIGG